MFMRNQGVRLMQAVALVMVCAPALVLAQGRVQANPHSDPPAANAPRPGTVGFEDLEYVRVHSNSVIEYGVEPPVWMSRPAVLRQAAKTVEYFIEDNAGTLGLTQDASDFTYVSTVADCDGAELVEFRQNHLGVPVDGAGFWMTVREGVVRHIEARLFQHVWLLPYCRPVGNPRMMYLPWPTNPVIVVILEDQVTQGVQRVMTNACDNSVVSTVISYEP